MRRLYFRLIVPDGPLRRFRLAEDFGEERKSAEGGVAGRALGMALAWCGLSAGCWLLAQGYMLPNVSLDPMIALSEGSSHSLAAVFPAGDELLAMPNVVPRGNLGVLGAHTGPAGAASSPAVDVIPNIKRDLPKISYTVSVLHQGGEWGRTDSARQEQPTSPEFEPMPEEPKAGGSREPTDVARLRTSLPAADRESPAEQLETEPSARVSTQRPLAVNRAAEDDPFEADFVPARVRLPLPGSEPAAPSKTITPPNAVTAPKVVTASDVVARGDRSPKREEHAGSSVLHTGGGCQAAFNASNQVVDVGKATVGTDATSEDYSAVLGRMNVATCNPPRRLSVQVCVAVSERRAVGTTVTTSPANAAVAACLARQIAGLRFPASTGADLVRTRIDVE